MKKILSVLLAVCLLVGCVPVVAWATETKTPVTIKSIVAEDRVFDGSRDVSLTVTYGTESNQTTGTFTAEGTVETSTSGNDKEVTVKRESLVLPESESALYELSIPETLPNVTVNITNHTTYLEPEIKGVKGILGMHINVEEGVYLCPTGGYDTITKRQLSEGIDLSSPGYHNDEPFNFPNKFENIGWTTHCIEKVEFRNSRMFLTFKEPFEIKKDPQYGTPIPDVVVADVTPDGGYFPNETASKVAYHISYTDKHVVAIPRPAETVFTYDGQPHAPTMAESVENYPITLWRYFTHDSSIPDYSDTTNKTMTTPPTQPGRYVAQYQITEEDGNGKSCFAYMGDVEFSIVKDAVYTIKVTNPIIGTPDEKDFPDGKPTLDRFFFNWKSDDLSLQDIGLRWKDVTYDNQGNCTAPIVEKGKAYEWIATGNGGKSNYYRMPLRGTLIPWPDGTTEPTEHTHNGDGEWKSDEDNHWHECTAEGCDLTGNPKKYGIAAHVYDQTGDTCICGAKKPTETPPATDPSGPSTPSTPTPAPAPKDEVTTTPTVSGGTANTTVSSSDGASLVEAAKQPGTGEVTVKVEPKEDITAANVTLPASTVTGVGAAKTDLTVETPVADITLPSAALTELGRGAGNVTVSAAVNDDETVSIDVKKDNTVVKALAQPMKAVIPAENVTSSTVAYLVDENGNETIIPKSISGKEEMRFPLKGSAKIKLLTVEKAFVDTQGHWADKEGAIGFAFSRQLFKGTSDTSFSPNTTMTRGMMVTVLHRLESTPKGSSVSFGDVSGDDYFAEAVAWGAENKIVEGTGGNSFAPGRDVTREQLATFLYRYAKAYGVDTAGRTNLASFPDSGNVSGYAKDALEWACNAGLMKGSSDGKLNPTGSAKRGEVAAILMRFVEYINK